MIVVEIEVAPRVERRLRSARVTQGSHSLILKKLNIGLGWVHNETYLNHN